MTSYTLFSQAAPTGINGSSSSADQVLGVIFQVSASASLNGIWFYSPSGAAALPSAVAVYQVSGHASVVTDNSPSWSGAAGSGWVFCNLSSYAITLTASVQYCAAAWSNGSLSGVWDDYSTDWWETGVGPGSGGVTNGILSAPDSSGGNIGVLLNSSGSIAYPTSSFSDSNYWVDVQVTPSSSPGYAPVVVQQATGSLAGSYGIGTTKISSTGGNGLVAFIGWNCTAAGTNVTVPAACVSDSTGNLWKQIAITPAGTSVASSTRCAIWATVNAQPVSWVSVGIAGYTSSAAWTIAEISGLPQQIQVDYSVGLNGTYNPVESSPQPSLTGVASGSDIGFTLFMSGNSPQTLVGPAGWTGLGTSVSYVPTGIFDYYAYLYSTAIYPYWNTGVSAGTVTTAGTFGTLATYSVVQCGISASASPPAQFSPDFPLFVTEAAFGATPGIISSSLDYTYSSEYVPWTDISTRVLGDAASGRVSASRGREYELQQEEAGNMTVYLANYDGAFTPTNPGSPYYSSAINSNMSFQSGVTGWKGLNGASVSSSTAQTYATGLNAVAYYSMLMTPNGSTAQPSAQNTVPVTVNQNYPYSFSCWMNCPAGYATGAYMTAHWLNSSGGTISSSVGGTIPLAAGTWTQLPLLDATPPSGAVGAVFGPVIQGTPSATPFYVAEAAAVVGPSAVATGLVTLEAPMRITCWWNGRQYPLWSGYVERWPQAWPDMPQWGFSQVTATDALAVAAANSMQSALIGEVLIDNPYAYLPCNEQYTTQVVGATPTNLFFYSGSPQLVPVDANGQIALNRAVGNQTTGTYLDGNNQQVSTGLSINFLGDDGTVMGAAGYDGNVIGQAGPSMLYVDPGLPALAASGSEYTIEFWFSLSASSEIVSLFSSYGAASAFTYTPPPLNYPNGVSINILYDSTSVNVSVNGNEIISSGTALSLNTPHHLVLTFASTSFTLYIDGAVVESTSTNVGLVGLNAVILGPGRYAYDCYLSDSSYYQADNYSAGHLAFYEYSLPVGRIAAHYEAGAAGWSGVSAAQRFAQVLDWAQLGLRRGGYLQSSATGVPEITQIGPAYQLNGTTASDAVNAIAQSEGGQYYVKADGTLSYIERPGGYNQTVQATLGDNATSATAFLNSNYSFSRGTAGWSASGCTIAASAAETYAGSGSILLTPNGSSASPAAAASAVAVTAGASYVAGAWVWSATGWADVTVGFSLLLNGSPVSTSVATVAVAEQSWSYITTTTACPASGVNQFSLQVGESGTPATGNTLYIAFAAMWEASAEVPYEKETEFDLDNSFLYNEVTATQESGPNDLTVYDDRNLPSEQSYFRRSALSIESNVVSPYDVSDVTTWSIASFAQPSIHSSAIKIDVSANPLIAFPVVLNVDIGDIVQVNRRPIGGAVISELGIVEKITYEAGARYFYVTYQVSPYAPANNVLCADTSGFDDPGANATLILGW